MVHSTRLIEAIAADRPGEARNGRVEVEHTRRPAHAPEAVPGTGRRCEQRPGTGHSRLVADRELDFPVKDVEGIVL